MKNYYFALKLASQIWMAKKIPNYIHVTRIKKLMFYTLEGLIFLSIIIAPRKKGVIIICLYFWMRYVDDILDGDTPSDISPEIFLDKTMNTVSSFSTGNIKKPDNHSNDFIVWFIYQIAPDKEKLHELVIQFFPVFQKELQCRREKLFPEKHDLEEIANGWGVVIFSTTFYFFGIDFKHFQKLVGARMYVFQEIDWLYGQYHDLRNKMIYFTAEDFKQMKLSDTLFFKNLGNIEVLESQKTFMEWREKKKLTLKNELENVISSINGKPSNSLIFNFLFNNFVIPKFKTRLANC